MSGENENPAAVQPIPGADPTHNHDDTQRINRIRFQYREMAPNYDEASRQSSWTGPEQIAAAVRAHISPGMRVLDAGTGTGEVMQRLRGIALDQPLHITGLDLSEDMLKIAAAKGLADHLYAHDLTQSWPVPHGTHDLVTSSGVMEHLDHAQVRALVREAARALKTGGRIVLTFLPMTQDGSTGRQKLHSVEAVAAIFEEHGITPHSAQEFDAYQGSEGTVRHVVMTGVRMGERAPPHPSRATFSIAEHPLKGLYLLRYGSDDLDPAASILDEPKSPLGPDEYVDHVAALLEASPLGRKMPAEPAARRAYTLSYINERKEMDSHLHTEARLKGIEPEHPNPLHFILHHSPSPDPPLMSGKVMVRIPAEHIPLSLISFTVDDSFYNFPGRPTSFRDPAHGTLFNSDEMRQRLDTLGWLGNFPETDIPRIYEAQLWTRRLADLAEGPRARHEDNLRDQQRLRQTETKSPLENGPKLSQQHQQPQLQDTATHQRLAMQRTTDNSVRPLGTRSETSPPLAMRPTPLNAHFGETSDAFHLSPAPVPGAASAFNMRLEGIAGKIGWAGIAINVVDAAINKHFGEAAETIGVFGALHGATKLVAARLGLKAVPIAGQILGAILAGEDSYSAAMSGHGTRAYVSGSESALYTVAAGAGIMAATNFWNPAGWVAAAVGGTALAITATKAIYDNWNTVAGWLPHEAPPSRLRDDHKGNPPSPFPARRLAGNGRGSLRVTTVPKTEISHSASPKVASTTKLPAPQTARP